MFKFVVFVIALFASTLVSAQTLEKMLEDKLEYEKFAGDTMQTLYAPRIHGWKPLGKEAVALFTSTHKAYILDLDGPCHNLDWSDSVQLKKGSSTIHAKFDSITVDGHYCKIESIRPVDYRALKAARRAAKNS